MLDRLEPGGSGPARIEALFCCQFLALLLGALIERQIRTAMAAAHTRDIPLYPELRACTAPSAERVLEILRVMRNPAEPGSTARIVIGSVS